ncbi:helix-turn-helix domain-containing protein [Thermopolyspora sp. NPDC052614]|uniref:PucR family transcriptional regulator n=1 Tax=Thermopolyspora sp. NPDC052614 TaxID=3155682 RepID=UPI00342F3064
MDLQTVVDEIADVLGAAATIEDRAFQLVAYCAQSGAIDRVREESILRRRATDRVRAYFEGFGIATATAPVRIPPDERLGVLARICVPLRHRGVTYGYLWLLDSGAVTDARLAAAAPLIRRAAAALAQEVRSRQDAGTALRALFSLDPDVRAEADVEPQGPVAAIAVRTASEAVAPLWSLPRGVLADPGEPLTALLAPAAQAREVARRVQAMYGTAAGVGGARDDAADAWQSWREAVHALRVAEAVERHGPVAAWPDLGVYRVLSRLPRPDLAELAAPAKDLTGELARTVEAYLDHGGHARETAEELGVHRQTLYYRLGRAERLTGLDLADGESRLLLHLGLKAAALIHS